MRLQVAVFIELTARGLTRELRLDGQVNTCT